MKPRLSGTHAVTTIALAMCSLGFRECNRSFTGSRYLKMPGTPFRLRISDHPWSDQNRRRYPDVVCSYVVSGPLDPGNVPDLAFTLGLRFVMRTRLRTGLIGVAA